MDHEHRPVVARVDDIGQLPTSWYGYEGVDAVVLSTSQAELYRKLMPEGARPDALDQWIRMGGRLVLCVGSRADEVLAPDSALKRFAPGRLEKIVPLRQTGALEMYCGSSVAVPLEQGRQISHSGGQAGRCRRHCRSPRSRFAAYHPHAARLGADCFRGRRSGPGAA